LHEHITEEDFEIIAGGLDMAIEAYEELYHNTRRNEYELNKEVK